MSGSRGQTLWAREREQNLEEGKLKKGSRKGEG
jgi:hypothetical protein